jgi:hypothetical protein
MSQTKKGAWRPPWRTIDDAAGSRSVQPSRHSIRLAPIRLQTILVRSKAFGAPLAGICNVAWLSRFRVTRIHNYYKLVPLFFVGSVPAYIAGHPLSLSATSIRRREPNSNLLFSPLHFGSKLAQLLLSLALAHHPSSGAELRHQQPITCR